MNMLTKLTTEDGKEIKDVLEDDPDASEVADDKDGKENKGVPEDDPEASEVADDKDLSIGWLKISKL